MLYPSILDYISALEQPTVSALTPRLRKLKLSRDKLNEPIYSIYRDYVIFSVEIKDKNYELRLFLNQEACDNYTKRDDVELLTKAISAYNGQKMVVVDALLREVIVEKTTCKELFDATSNGREGRVPFQSEGKWGFRDCSGEVVVKAQYDSVELFYEGRAVVKRDGYYGAINYNGDMVVEMLYDDISYDNSYWFYVEREGFYGVLDRNGKTVLECEWDWVGEQSCELFLVESEGMYRYMDSRGCDAMNMEYNQATSFSADGLARVTRSGLSYYIDVRGLRASPISSIPIRGR